MPSIPSSSSVAEGTVAVDNSVDAFEAARTQGPGVEIRDFLPHREHPLFLDVLTELVRVDLEYHWENDTPKTLDDYRELAAELFADMTCLEAAAFEEYRLRRQAGEQVPASHYSTKYGVNTTGWPVCTVSGSASNAELLGGAGLENEQEELDRLTDIVADFPVEGESFLEFQLLREIGRGSFARAFLSRQNDLAGRLVVLKVSSDASLEPQHLARLQHTNIVPIYSVHQSGALRGVCMPYFGEATLADVLRATAHDRDRPATGRELLSTIARRDDETIPVAASIPYERSRAAHAASSRPPLAEAATSLESLGYVDACVWIGQQIASGLAHAHSCGIVHRDLKPANVLLTDAGRPMLLDFNLSENLVVGSLTALVVGGTLPYMAPEQLRAVQWGGQTDERSDVYSVGVMLYELLTGQRPFPTRRGEFDSMVATMVADRQAGASPVRQLNPSVPRSLVSIVNRCLAEEPTRRYRSAAELLEDLDCELNNLPLRHAPDRNVAVRARKWARRHPRWVSAGAIAAAASVLLALAAILLVARGQQVAHWQAAEQFRAFEDDFVSARLALTMPDAENSLLTEGDEIGRLALSRYQSHDLPDWRGAESYKFLSADQQAELDADVVQLLYLLANARSRLATGEGESQQGRRSLQGALEFNQRATDSFHGADPPRALMVQRADLLARLGRPTDSIRYGDNTQSRGDLDIQLSALQLLADRRFDEALGELAKLRDEHPTDPVWWFVLGNAYVGLDEPHEAIGCYTTCLALQPDSYAAVFYRGRVHLEMSKYEAALADFERAVEIRPDQPACLLNRSLAHRALGNNRQAIRDLTRSLELGASETRIYFLRAELYDLVGDHAAAIEDRQHGLSAEPTDEKSWVARGIAKLPLDAEAALNDFQQASRRYPGSELVMTNLIHVLADRLERRSEALVLLNQLLAVDPDNASALAGRGVLAARMGDADLAQDDLQRLLSQPQTPLLTYQAACGYAQLAEFDPRHARRALELIRDALQHDARLAARIRTDPDLIALHNLPEWEKILSAAEVLNDRELTPH